MEDFLGRLAILTVFAVLIVLVYAILIIPAHYVSKRFRVNKAIVLFLWCMVLGMVYTFPNISLYAVVEIGKLALVFSATSLFAWYIVGFDVKEITDHVTEMNEKQDPLLKQHVV
jgi:hypothetical protein